MRNFLDSDDPRIWSSAAAALYPQKHLKNEVRDSIWKYLKDPRPGHFSAALQTILVIKDNSFMQYLLSLVNKIDENVSTEFILTLSCFGHKEALEYLVQLLIDHEKMPDSEMENFYTVIAEFPPDARNSIESLLKPVIFEQLHDFLKSHQFTSLHDIPLDLLKKLRKMYLLLNISEEVFRIDEVLKQKNSIYHPPLLTQLYV